MFKIISQILIIIADVFFAMSVFSKSKVRVALWLIISYIFFGVHYFFLGGFTGAYIIFADIIFLTILYFTNKYNKNKFNILFSIIFACISIIITIFTWNGIISLFPMLGMTIYFLGMGISNLVYTKLALGIKNLCNIIYMFILASYIGAGLEIILMACSIIGSIRDYKSNKQVSLEKSNKENIVNNQEETTKE